MNSISFRQISDDVIVMRHVHTAVTNKIEELLRECHPWSSQFEENAFWCPEPSSPGAEMVGIEDAASLRKALRHFKTSLLIPVELPAIYRSCRLASANDLEGLLRLDASLEKQISNPTFARASQNIGRVQLKRLRPLKDHRVTRRLLEAVNRGSANGWHTLVYGVSLEIYSIPTRQGLLHYANRTLWTLLDCGAKTIDLREREATKMFEDLIRGIPASIDRLLPKFSKPNVRLL